MLTNSHVRELNFFSHLLMFGCAGSLLLCEGFLSCSKQGLFSSYSAQASRCGGFPRWGASVLDVWAL